MWGSTWDEQRVVLLMQNRTPSLPRMYPGRIGQVYGAGRIPRANSHKSEWPMCSLCLSEAKIHMRSLQCSKILRQKMPEAWLGTSQGVDVRCHWCCKKRSCWGPGRDVSEEHWLHVELQIPDSAKFEKSRNKISETNGGQQLWQHVVTTSKISYNTSLDS